MMTIVSAASQAGSSYLLPVFGIAIILGLASALPGLKAIFERERAFLARMKQCGELGPWPSDKIFSRWMAAARWVVWAFVGKVEVLGAENLEGLSGPFMFAANHGSSIDPFVAACIIKRKAYFPADYRVTTSLGGLPIFLGGRAGVFTVNPNNGRPAYNTLVQVLSDGHPVVIFPEALIHVDGSFWQFKTGTARAAQAASQNRGECVPIVPVWFRYGSYPGNWVNQFGLKWWQGLVPLLPWYRKGVRIFIGKPIDPRQLPADAKESTRILRDAIGALDPETHVDVARIQQASSSSKS